MIHYISSEYLNIPPKRLDRPPYVSIRVSGRQSTDRNNFSQKSFLTASVGYFRPQLKRVTMDNLNLNLRHQKIFFLFVFGRILFIVSSNQYFVGYCLYRVRFVAVQIAFCILFSKFDGSAVFGVRFLISLKCPSRARVCLDGCGRTTRRVPFCIHDVDFVHVICINICSIYPKCEMDIIQMYNKHSAKCEGKHLYHIYVICRICVSAYFVSG